MPEINNDAMITSTREKPASEFFMIL